MTPSSSNGGNNYSFLTTVPQNRWELKPRVDYSLSQNTKIFFAYTRQNETDGHPSDQRMVGALAIPAVPGRNYGSDSVGIVCC